MKNFITLIIFVPIVLFAIVIVTVVQRVSSSPSAFSLEDFPMPPIGESPETDDPKIQAGWKVFTSKGCVYCHGAAGAGGIKNPNAVGGLIPSLTRVAEGYNEEELKDRIRKGVKSEDIATEPGADSPPPLYMPSWKDDLTERELDDLVHYLISLAPESDDSDWE